MTRVFCVGTAKTYNERPYQVYVKANLNNAGGLSITGVEGPLPNGNCLGSCDQINTHDWHIVDYENGWNKAKVNRLRDIWKRWHLNDLRAECVHQRERGERWKTTPSITCPQCGWKLGHGWCTEPIPADIITELFSFPETNHKPTWV